MKAALLLAALLACTPRRIATPRPADTSPSSASSGDAPLYELLARDAIPSLDAPAFVSAAEVTLAPTAKVLGVLTPAEEPRAYPIWTLERHEVVNDAFGAVPVAVTYSPLTDSAAVYLRPMVDGKPTTLGVSGKLWNDAGVLYDRATESLWSQFDGACLAGAHAGARLESYPATTATWEAWRRLHPETRVLEGPHPSASGYAEYHRSGKLGVTGFAAPDPRLPPKTRVLGVRSGEAARAYPLDALPPFLQDTVGGQPIVILAHAGGARVFVRRAAGRDLTFDAASGASLRDRETGTTWSHDGVALDGPLAGKPLPAAPSAQVAYWFAWARFYPTSEVRSRKSE